MYKYKREITIDHTKIDTPLVNYPVMVKLTDGNFNFDEIENSNGYDVIFKKGDMQLNYELELFINLMGNGPTNNYTIDATLDKAYGTMYFENYEEIRKYYPDISSSNSIDYTRGNYEGAKCLSNYIWNDSGVTMVQHNNGDHPKSIAVSKIYSGTNLYTLNNNIIGERWVEMFNSGGSYTTSCYLGNIQFRVNGTLKTLETMVNDGDISSVVLLGSESWSINYMWSNVRNWYTGGNCESRSYPHGFITFRTNSGVTIDAVQIYSNKNFDTSYPDGFRVNSWNPEEGELYTEGSIAPHYEYVGHVKLPTISDTEDTIFEIHYGNPNITTDQSDSTNVWDDNFIMVQHMGESLLDSTSNNNDGINYGSTIIDGLNGKARSFDGTNDYINITNANTVLGDGNRTYQAIFNTTNVSSTGTIFGINDSSGDSVNIFGLRTDTLAMFNNDVWDESSTTIVNDGIDHSTQLRYNGSIYDAFLDGTFEFNSPVVTDYNSSNQAFIGSELDTTTQSDFYSGIIDEVRISNIARSDAWIKADDYNLRLATLFSIGDEELGARVTGVTITQLPNVRKFFIGDDLNVTGLLVNVTYDDETNETFEPLFDIISGYDNTIAEQNQVLTVTQGDYSDTYTINMVNEASIEISQEPTKTIYFTSDIELNIEGLAVIINYTDGTTSSYVPLLKNVIGFDTSTPTSNLILTVSYEGYTQTHIATFSVEIVEPAITAIDIIKPFIKTSYKIGESLDIAGVELIGEYEDGINRPIIIMIDNFSILDSSTVGLKIVTVTLEGITRDITLRVIEDTTNIQDIELGEKLIMKFTESLKQPTSTQDLVSFNKFVSGGPGILDARGCSVTNGDTTSVNYISVSGVEPAWVEIDLGEILPINKINIWHYYDDERTYHETKLEVSEDSINWTILFDSITEGEYPETSVGKSHIFSITNVRYIRDWVHGSSVNTGNHWVEIDVYGLISKFNKDAFTISGEEQRYIGGPIDIVTYEINDIKRLKNSIEYSRNELRGLEHEEQVDEMIFTDFETGFGSWVPSEDSVNNWSIHTGGTPSSSTGPPSAFEGSYYIYTESSSTTPPSGIEKDFGNSKSGIITFHYHMYGADMGTLTLYGFNNTGWIYLWSNSNTSYEWHESSINFENISKVKFVHSGYTGYRGDCALDAISIGFKLYKETTNLLFENINLVGEKTITADIDMEIGTNYAIYFDYLGDENFVEILNESTQFFLMESKVKIILSTTDTSKTPILNHIYIGEKYNNDVLIVDFTSLNSFKNTHNSITVNYSQIIGNLQGYGGNIESFEATFIPIALDEFVDPIVHEIVTINTIPVTNFIKIQRLNAYSSEEILNVSAISLNTTFIYSVIENL